MVDYFDINEHTFIACMSVMIFVTFSTSLYCAMKMYHRYETKKFWFFAFCCYTMMPLIGGPIDTITGIRKMEPKDLHNSSLEAMETYNFTFSMWTYVSLFFGTLADLGFNPSIAMYGSVLMIQLLLSSCIVFKFAPHKVETGMTFVIFALFLVLLPIAVAGTAFRYICKHSLLLSKCAIFFYLALFSELLFTVPSMTKVGKGWYHNSNHGRVGMITGWILSLAGVLFMFLYSYTNKSQEHMFTEDKLINEGNDGDINSSSKQSI